MTGACGTWTVAYMVYFAVDASPTSEMQAHKYVYSMTDTKKIVLALKMDE